MPWQFRVGLVVLCAMMSAATGGQHIPGFWVGRGNFNPHYCRVCLCGCVKAKWSVSGHCHHFVLFVHPPFYLTCLSVFVCVWVSVTSLSWHLKRMHVSFYHRRCEMYRNIGVCVCERVRTAVVTSGLKQQWQMGQGSGRRGSKKLGHHSTVCLSLSLYFALLSWNIPLSLSLSLLLTTSSHPRTVPHTIPIISYTMINAF